MLRRTLVIIAAAVISVFWLSGCKKRPSEPGATKEKVKTIADYTAEAAKEIDKKNMADELDKLGKEIDQDISEGQ
jgi:hypothetical protein